MRPNINIRKFKDGSRYEGEYKNKVREGKGIYHYINGDIYIGEWKNNIFDGNGIYIY